MNINTLCELVSSWLENNVVTGGFASPWQRVGVRLALDGYAYLWKQKFVQNLPALKSMGYVTDNDEVDMDMLERRIGAALAKEGKMSLDVLSKTVTFDESDFRSLLDFIRNGNHK